MKSVKMFVLVNERGTCMGFGHTQKKEVDYHARRFYMNLDRLYDRGFRIVPATVTYNATKAKP
jgi:hypothetical protein